MQGNTKRILAVALGGLVSLSITTTGFAADRTCTDKQVRAAVFKSAQDLPAPFNGGDAIGASAEGEKTGAKGECKMTLIFNMGLPDAKVLYNIDVPLSKLKVRLADGAPDSAKSDKKACKQIMFPKGHVSTSVDGAVAGFNKTQENIPSQCYKITTGANQTAKVSVTSTNSNSVVEVVNTENDNVLSHDGGDDKLEFLTKKTTYRLEVSQSMPSPDSDNYTLSVEVR